MKIRLAAAAAAAIAAPILLPATHALASTTHVASPAISSHVSGGGGCNSGCGFFVPFVHPVVVTPVVVKPVVVTPVFVKPVVVTPVFVKPVFVHPFVPLFSSGCNSCFGGIGGLGLGI